MNKAFKIILMISSIIVVFSISSCTAPSVITERTEQKSTAVETKDNKISEEYIKLEEKKVELDKRAEEFNEFIDKIANLENKYVGDINDLIDKFNESDNIDKKDAYSELELEKYKSFYDELSDIYAPEIAKEAYNYYLSYLTKEQLVRKAFINRNISDFEKYALEADEEYTKSIKEIERIHTAFDKEYEQLNSEFEEISK
jgi:hypothetical protein